MGWSGGGAAAGMARGLDSARFGYGHGLPAQHRTLPPRPSPPSRTVRKREGGGPAGRRRCAPATPAVAPTHLSPGCPQAAPPRHPSAPPPPDRCPPAFPQRLARLQPPGCPRLPPSRASARQVGVFITCPGVPCVPEPCVPRWQDVGQCCQSAHE